MIEGLNNERGHCPGGAEQEVEAAVLHCKAVQVPGTTWLDSRAFTLLRIVVSVS